MINKKYSAKEIKGKYDEYADNYDLLSSISNILVFGRLRRELLARANGRVLEVGFGTGANLKYYPKSCKITALDLSGKMIEIAKTKAYKLERKINFHIGDAENMPFDNNSFDSVIDTLCVCTYPNPVRALREMARVCKPNGKILLLEHGISDYSFVKRLQVWRENRHYGKLGCSLVRNPLEIAKEAGLEISEEKRNLFGIAYSIVARKKN